MATIGLRDVYYAELLTDPASGTPTYDTSVRIVGAMSANVNPNTSTDTLFADDGPFDTATTMGDIELELNMADIPLETQAFLLGHTFASGLLIRRSSDSPPWVAIAYKTLKSNGAYRYYWLAKGKFAIPEEAYETRGDSISFQTPTITGAFVKRDSDDEWQRTADEDDTGFAPNWSTDWFDDPLTP